MTFAPAPAAVSAAAQPAPPPPTTRTSVLASCAPAISTSSISASRYAHLALAFCRCLNIPARYCTGYVSDIGLPPPFAPMDFAAWIEVYLGGKWRTPLTRITNDPRIGRILIARGRDDADVLLTLTFGPNTLVGFTVVTEEVSA